MEEFEIKFLEVDVPELEKKLKAIGAKKVGEYDYSRAIFDYPDLRLKEDHAWIRLRTDGKETTLSYKKNIKEKLADGSKKDIGAKEIEVFVDDYKKAYKLLKATGLVVKREEKNKRVRYLKNDVVFDIDFWPFIPPYLEIESGSHKKSENAAREIGLDPKDSMIGSSGSVYKKYGYNLHDYSYIDFKKMIKK